MNTQRFDRAALKLAWSEAKMAVPAAAGPQGAEQAGLAAGPCAPVWPRPPRGPRQGIR
jgi:hypothetical protein